MKYQVKARYVDLDAAEVVIGTYRDDSLAVELRQGHDTERVSINLEAYFGPESLDGDEFYVKNYSEHIGLAEALIAAGIAEDTGRQVVFGPYESSANIMKLVAEYVVRK